uniref:Uncharacterized protein n=1 Tax=Neogobius melanostomus TaxID=47308 RepID=A0A8C6T6Z2_9GOBI
FSSSSLSTCDKAVFCIICLKEAATLPCGHNFCKSCIQSFWGGQEQSSCPQCRQSFSPRPVIVTNTMLATLVEQLKTTEVQNNLMALNLSSGAPFQMTQRQGQLQIWRGQILHSIHDKEAALQKLQQEALYFRHCADEAVKHSERNLSGLCQMLQFVHSEVSREIKALQEKEEAQLKQLHDQLQRDIILMRMTVSELDSLTPGRALQHCPPLSAPDPPRTYALSMGSLEQAASAVTALTDLLKVTLKDGLQNISQGFRPDPHPLPRPEAALSLPDPKTREEFINYAREIVLDPNTAHKYLSLSRGNRQAKYFCSSYINNYPDHPDRFSDYYQVLSTEGLTGRCYWEVEKGRCDYVDIAVSYKDIGRKGDSEKCGFGYNEKSWALNSGSTLAFWHHSVETKVSHSVSDRIGVYLDHSAGVLAFYNIDKNQTMSLLHRVQTTFTQPIYAGVRLTCSVDTAYFPKLK